jgi:C-terminal processing protease CtpA/Prc
MMKRTLFSALAAFICVFAHAQFTNSTNKIDTRADTVAFASGSGVLVDTLSDTQVQHLSLLGKVWGFLKYYHPSVAAGNYNWDYELLRILPAYLQVANPGERDALLVNWINAFGTVPRCKNCPDKLKDVVLQPDLEWMNDTSLSEPLRDMLRFIKDNRHLGKQFYVNLVAGVENPNILNENPYAQFTLPDAGYRILALFRYWNIIQYWFPNRHLIGEDWKLVLNAFIPKFVQSTTAMEYWKTTQQLIGRIHDTHANLVNRRAEWNNRMGRYYPPVMITFVNNQPVVSAIMKDTLADLSQLEVGDVIKMIKDKDVESIIEEQLPNLPASNLPTQLRNLSWQLLRSEDSLTSITIEREGKLIKTQLHRFIPVEASEWYRYDFPYQSDSSFFFIRPDIGYINLGRIQKKQVDSVFKVLDGSKGLIIDNRQYPGDFPIYQIAAKLNLKRVPFTTITTATLKYPGAFITARTLQAGTKSKSSYKGKVILLVNENTQSSAEFHTMAFQTAPNAVVVGSTTAGADGNVTNLFYLPGNIGTLFSGIGILYPDGRETQRVGIVPDVEVKRTVAGIRNRKDELIEKAIALIQEDSKTF